MSTHVEFFTEIKLRYRIVQLVFFYYKKSFEIRG